MAFVNAILSAKKMNIKKVIPQNVQHHAPLDYLIMVRHEYVLIRVKMGFILKLMEILMECVLMLVKAIRPI